MDRRNVLTRALAAAGGLFAVAGSARAEAVTRDKSLVENEVIAKKSSAIEVIPGLRVWTDDYNNLFDILK